MLFSKLSAGNRRIQNRHLIIFLLLMMAIMIALSACSASKGSIVILENADGTGFTMDFQEWSAKNKCELFLNKGDEVKIEVVSEDGEIAFSVNGKNGSEPYRGNDLPSRMFTVTVSETDDYVFAITGKAATGKITVKNLGSQEE